MNDDRPNAVSWITGTSTSRDDLLDLRPSLASDHRSVLDTLWDGPVSGRTLELCRLRTAKLLGNQVGLAERTANVADLDESTIDALDAWPTDERFTEADRASIALSEQYVLDVHGVTDAMIDRVSNAVGSDGVVTLTTALALWELTHRFDNALLDTASTRNSSTTSTVRSDATDTKETL